MANSACLRRMWLLLGVLFATVLVTPAIAAGPSRLRVNMGGEGEAVGLDSLQVRSATQSRFIKNLARGLVTLDQAGHVVGDLAVSWQAEASHRAYVFELRPAQFSDGSPLTCADVAATLARGRMHREAIHFDFAMFTGVHCESPTRLRLELRAAMPDLPVLLGVAELRVLSPHDAAAPLGQQTFAVTSGAYRVRALTPVVVFERNRYCPAPEAAPDEVEVSSLDGPAAMAALQAGQLDVAFAPMTLTAAHHRDLTAAGQVAVHDFHISFAFWLSINPALVPAPAARRYLQRVARLPLAEVNARGPVWLPAAQLLRDDGAGRIEAAWLKRFWQRAQRQARPVSMPAQLKVLLPSDVPLNELVLAQLAKAGLAVTPTYYATQTEFANMYRAGGFHLFMTNNDYGRRDPSGGLLVTLSEARPLVLLASPDSLAKWAQRIHAAITHEQRMGVVRELGKLLLARSFVVPLAHYQNLLYYNTRVDMQALATTYADVAWWKMRIRS